MINCHNEFCIYQRDDECMFDEIEINAIGSCTYCILADIPEEYLKFEKEKLLKMFDDADRDD